MKTWQELLNEDVEGLEPSEFGPKTPQVAAAIWALRVAAWFKHLGEPISDADRLVQVHAWSDVVRIFDQDEYTVGGHLLAPVEQYDDFLDKNSQHAEWWQGAVAHAMDRVPIPPPPPDAPAEHRDMLIDHTELYIPKLLAEIICEDSVDCVYFREQLQWFFAGHFPCGWQGSWPAGRMKVY